jgi:peptidyl-prolyl cis-trans isomerase C
MNKISKALVLLGAVAPLAAFGVTPDQPPSTNAAGKPSTSLDSLFSDSVVVKGKGVEVKRNELDREVVNARAAYAARQIPAPADLEQQALRTLVIDKLVMSKATDADRAKAKKDFEDHLNEVKTQNHWTDEELNRRISMQLIDGKTRQQWEQENVEQATVPIALERELNIKVTDEDAKKFYDDPANISSFEQPEMVRASHILLMTTDPQTQQPLPADKKAAKHKEMEDILKQARAGTNFAELAKKYSEDPGSKDSGGEYTFPRGRMVKPFEDAAFSLKTNEISDIIETQYGYHIIKLSEKVPAKKVDFDKVKDQIKDHQMQVQIRKQLRPYVAKLEKDANVEIVDENLKGTDLLPPEPQEAPAAGGAMPPTGAK